MKESRNESKQTQDLSSLPYTFEVLEMIKSLVYLRNQRKPELLEFHEQFYKTRLVVIRVQIIKGHNNNKGLFKRGELS